ncbi:MAG: T9SS type A sorting domain-containing protein [Bacteroidia bacterium]
MNNYTKAVFVILASLTCSLTYAQPWAKPSMLSTEQLKKKSLNFYDLQETFNRYWEGKNSSIEENENIEEGGYQQFKRAEWFLKPRVFPTGNFNSLALYNEYKNYKNKAASQHVAPSTAAANWTFIGPDVVPTDGGGLGRINCMAFYPGQPDTMFIGAACGGLWRTNDGGATWSSNTDLLPSLSISEIVINPAHPDTMYLATGDKYGIYFQYEVIGHYSAGILMSSDGGATWNQTSLNLTQAQNILYQRLIINPLNPSILILAASNGIYRTIDGGANWTNVQAGGMFYDLEFNAGNPSTVYAVNGDNFYRSTDGGATWNIYGGTLAFSGDRVSVETTPADTNVVYVWDLGNQFYYSANGGASFTLRGTPGCTPYGYYDDVISVSPVDENTLYAGGLNVAKSTNGGVSWNTITDWNGFPSPDYTHADHHAIEFFPGSNTNVFVVNDGGIFKTTNGGTVWTDITAGIGISQFYRFANDQTDPSLIYAGAQDNGTDRYNGTSWDRVFGADGMECMIDFNNSNNVYVAYQGGGLQKSTDGGVSFTGIAPCGGDWTTPYEMSPINPDHIYSACYDIYESLDAGLSWNTLSTGLSMADAFYCFKVAPSDPNTMYAAEFGHIFRTANHGTTWTEITGTLPVSNAAITFIAIKDINPDELWVTFSGYSAGNKVFYSDDGGTTWLNVSGTLPNIPVTCIIYQNNSNDILYIGTDFGVFQTDNTLNDWLPYNTGLPNVIIDELEIQYGVSKLRAATYGRGVWESDLAVSVLVPVDAGTFAIVSPQGSYCDSLVNVIVRIRNYGVDTLTSVDVNYFFDANAPQVYNWSGSLAHNATVDITLPSATMSPGAHTFTAFTSNPNGVIDNNPANDSHSSNFFINTVGIPTPIVEGFESGIFPPSNWNLNNSGGLMSLYNGTGGFGNSTHCVKVDFYAVQNGTALLSPPSVNLYNLIPPIIVDFDVAYRQFNNTYHDSLFVDVSSDCGVTFTRLYSKGDQILSTTTPSNNIFVPLSTEWRKDTVDITAYAGAPAFEIRFIAKSGFGNNLYLDNINIHSNTVGITENKLNNDVLLYPNPSSGKFYLQLPASAKYISAKVTDVLGNEVWNAKAIIANKTVIDLSGKAKGVYFLEIKSNGFNATRKLSLMD